MNDFPPTPELTGRPTEGPRRVTSPDAKSEAPPGDAELAGPQSPSERSAPSIESPVTPTARPVSDAGLEPQPAGTAPIEPAAAAALAGAAPTGSSANPAAAAEKAAVTAPAAIGVLLVNLGTPDAAEPAAIRRYLKEFLTDQRVIEKDSLLWKMMLNAVVLPLRSRRKAHDYQKIWNHEKDESPLKTITRSQADKLAGLLEPLSKHVVVDWAMRYAHPSIASGLEGLLARGCDRILVMPLYPQYAAASTATACDAVFRFLMRQRRQPALRILPPYYDDPCYIDALASSLKAQLQALAFEPDVIIASYHGIPREYARKGDPYPSHCLRTTELLRERLGLEEGKLIMTFQSRFGRSEWLQPYTIRTVKSLAKKGAKNLVVIMPGFAADCLETLEEAAVEIARVFKRSGGQNFVAVPCLNDSEAGMSMISRLATRELQGWL